MTHPFPDFLENREFPVWFILYEWTFVLQKSIIHHINECSKVERNHKGEKCKISAAFKTSTIKFSSTTSLLHRYHANDLIENTKVMLILQSINIHFTYDSFIHVFFRIDGNHNFCQNLPFFTFVTSNHKPIIGRLFASAIKFLFRHFDPSFVKFSFSLGLVRLLNRGLWLIAR